MSAVTPHLELTRCVRYRYRYSACARCHEACPHDAIALNDAGLVVDAAKCRNCALCTAACPTAALVPGNLPRIELLKQAIRGKRCGFACAPCGAPADAIVPCLGALDAAMLGYLGKRGIAVELSGSGHCARCEHGPTGGAALARHVAARDALEAACTEESWAPLTLVEDEPEPAGTQDFRPGRRGLFRRLLGRGVAEVEKAIAQPQELPVIDKAIRPGRWHVPEMRELLALACRRAGDESCRVPAQPALPMAEMQLGQGCTLCEACLRVCPTGALQIRETDSDWAFMFHAERCVGCGVCAEVCQPRVLRSGATADLAPGRAIAFDIRAKQRCARCDRFFVSPAPQAVCPVCGDDDSAFGQIFG